MKQLKFGIICLIFVIQLTPSLRAASVVTGSQQWVNQSQEIKSWFNNSTLVEDKVSDDYRSQSTYSGSVTGYQEFIDWINPANNTYTSTPGPIVGESGNYTVVGSPHDLDYSTWTGHAANVTTSAAGTVTFRIVYQALNGAGIPSGTNADYDSTSVVGSAVTNSNLFYDKSPSPAAIVSTAVF